MKWFKRKPKEEEKEKSLEELQREYYKRGIDFYNLPGDIANAIFWGLLITLVGFGGLLGVMYVASELSPIEKIPAALPAPYYSVVDAIITGEDADCFWVVLINEDGKWEEICIPKHKKKIEEGWENATALYLWRE